MSIFTIFHAILNKKEPGLVGAICPNCGQKIQQSSAAENKFHCPVCGYKVPDFERIATAVFPKDKNLWYEWLFIILGVCSAIIGLKSFLVPNGLIDGGVTGMSMLFSHVFGTNLAIVVFFMNIPFVIFAFFSFNRNFAIRAALSISLLAILLPFVDVPVTTHDKLLDAVFGGFFLGTGIAFSIRGGGVLDGTEIMALMISKKFPATVGDAILFFNIIIFSIAALFLKPESVLYSVLTYFSASKTVDFMMHGIESFNGVLIISSRSNQIRFAIVNNLERGVTLLKGKGGYSEKDQDVIFCVLTRLEIGKMKRIVEELDKNAFFVIFPISDSRGGVVKKFIHEKAIFETPAK